MLEALPVVAFWFLCGLFSVTNLWNGIIEGIPQKWARITAICASFLLGPFSVILWLLIVVAAFVIVMLIIKPIESIKEIIK